MNFKSKEKEKRDKEEEKKAVVADKVKDKEKETQGATTDTTPSVFIQGEEQIKTHDVSDVEENEDKERLREPITILEVYIIEILEGYYRLLRTCPPPHKTVGNYQGRKL